MTKPRERTPGALARSEADNISPKQKAALKALDDGIPLAILGLALLFSMRFLPIGEDEALALSAAAQPFKTILAQFRSGFSLQYAPTLYALWLHLWLVMSNGALAALRAPSALFFLAGVWLLSRATRFWGGDQSANALLWLATVWPYAFHYGSTATVCSFTFFLIAALLSAYAKFCELPNPRLWAVVCALGLLLIYVSYSGWAFLILLGADYRLRNRGQSSSAGRRLLGTVAGLAIAYAPLWPTTLRELWSGAHSRPSVRGLLLNAGYNLYVMVVSESVAPWFWRFGVPVILAIAIALVLCWMNLRWEARRFLLFGGLLVVLMDLLGVLRADRLLLVAPLFLLPVAIALCTMENRNLRRAVAVALLVAVGVGWYGVYARRFYATGRFSEPWPGLSAETAGAIQQGAGLVSNSPSLFLYLTYDLAKPDSANADRTSQGRANSESASTSGFSSFLPETVHNPQVWSADRWIAAGRPIQPYMIWIGTASSLPSTSQPMSEAVNALDSRCGGRVVRDLVRDPAYEWKNRLFPQLNALPWRIEIRQYLCNEAPTPSSATVAPTTQPLTRAPTPAPAKPGSVSPAH